MQKQLKETQYILTSSADRVAHIDGNSCNYCIPHTRFQREYNVFQSNKNGAIHLRMFAWLALNNIFCAATNFGCIDSFLLAQFQKRRMMGDGFLWCYCCRFVLNSKRLPESTSCNKQGQRSSEQHFFMVLSDAF